MFRRTVISLFSLVAFLLSLPNFVLACACCAEPGLYSIRTAKPSTYELGIIKEIEFDRVSKLYLTEAAFEMIKGLEDIKLESETSEFIKSGGAFNLVNSFTGKQWKFDIRSAGGKRGVLSLPMPSQMVIFKVDIHEEDERPNGPNLYKEFRFKGNVSGGTGIFRSTMARPTTYLLVFQGRGNGCDNASDFTHWRLEINGPRAQYAFFGELDSAADDDPSDAEKAKTSR